MKTTVYDTLRKKLIGIIKENGLEADEVVIRAAPLSVEAAIGRPADRDYPLITGRERLMEADFHGNRGQAFTDTYDNFSGRLSDIVAASPEGNFQRAVFIATLNAVLRHLGHTARTGHCKDEEPRQCATELAEYVAQSYGQPKIAFIGFQPRMIEALAPRFEVKVTDMDKQNIGTEKFGTVVRGPEQTAEHLAWCDLALVTGTTVVNDTLGSILEMSRGKDTVFYGTTIAGAAEILGLRRFCHCGH